MTDIILTVIYLACCSYAFFKGFRKPFIIISLFLALSFQYFLGFSLIAKITVAVIFLLYFVLPDIRNFLGGKPEPEEELEPQNYTPPNNSNMRTAGTQSNQGNTNAQSVYEDLQEFSRRKKAKKKPKE